ncbi:hypothetical protein BpHYR1_039823, partial [Brachionus plicatilis]
LVVKYRVGIASFISAAVHHQRLFGQNGTVARQDKQSVSKCQPLALAEPHMPTDPQLRQPPEAKTAYDLPFERARLISLVARPVHKVIAEHRRLRKPLTNDERHGQSDRRYQSQRQSKAQSLHAQLARQSTRVVAQSRAHHLQNHGRQIRDPSVFRQRRRRRRQRPKARHLITGPSTAIGAILKSAVRHIIYCSEHFARVEYARMEYRNAYFPHAGHHACLDPGGGDVLLEQFYVDEFVGAAFDVAVDKVLPPD